MLHTLCREYPELSKAIITTNSMGPTPVVCVREEKAAQLRAIFHGFATIEVVGIDAEGRTVMLPGQRMFDFMHERPGSTRPTGKDA